MEAVRTPSNSSLYVDISTLDLRDAGNLLNEALRMVNEKLDNYTIEYNGQPMGALKDDGQGLRIAPKEPIDLAIVYGNGTKESLDFVNVVSWTGYDPSIGRLTTGFKTPEILAKEIIEKLEEHLTAKSNPHILISVEGSKYNVEHLKINKVTIDRYGYLRINDIRLWSLKGGPLKASALRSSKVMNLSETHKVNSIYILEKGEVAPHFYIDLSQIVQHTLNDHPVDKKVDAQSYLNEKGGKYYQFLREPGTV